MAESYSHKFGQIIGDLLELALKPRLLTFANKHKLYLDTKGIRSARTGKKLSWIDIKENKHDLDFVLERDGTDANIGTPVAFIETAWRRYTKHSRNKAQEIQGAILPLVQKYSSSSPFIGAVLAGEFTSGAITQLKTSGFGVLYFPYSSVIQAFSKHGINAAFDEGTPEEDFKEKLRQWEKVSNKNAIAVTLMELNKAEADEFFSQLENSVLRHIESIIIWPLHGSSSLVNSVEEAIKFLNGYSETNAQLPFSKYEIIIKYNTGTRIDAICISKAEAIEFLQKNGQ